MGLVRLAENFHERAASVARIRCKGPKCGDEILFCIEGIPKATTFTCSFPPGHKGQCGFHSQQRQIDGTIRRYSINWGPPLVQHGGHLRAYQRSEYEEEHQT